MHITLTPQRRDDALTLHRAGEVLTINGATLDLSAIPDGATLPQSAITGPGSEWLAGDIQRIDGVLHLALILPHGPLPWPAPPEALAVTHPTALIDPPDGQVDLPRYTAPEETADAD